MKTTIVILSLVLCSLQAVPAQTKAQTQKPNIIILLVDDAGYADFGFAGSKDLKTPNIDALANNGVIFTDAHVSATVCGPSRAGLITGRYQQRFGFECNPGGHDGIDLAESTIGDAMKQAGYTTAAFGKWHLGDQPAYRPNQRGFDYYYGFLSGGRSYFSNAKQDKEGTIQSIRENDNFTTFDGYLTDVLGQKAAAFIHKNASQPFFIYWAPNAVHGPMEATIEDLALFKNHPRQKLAAMTWALDRAVGKITDQLKADNLLENTLIFFLSDNGGAHYNQSSNYPLKGNKGNKFEGGHRVAFFAHWPAQVKGGKRFDGLSSSLDIFATCIDVTNQKITTNKPIDGTSLIPYLQGKKTGNPHQELFWRKDKMAAMRNAEFKMIRVVDLGYRLYDLNEDLGEEKDLCTSNADKLAEMQSSIKQWESKLMQPLWTEGESWDKITWMIHEDLFFNRPIRVTSPEELKRLTAKTRK